ncbi:MAG: hypothetical protein KF858_05410 [Candidatus Sumerlaeia bacterium]|nr:hypothetical protein [Candidatus Sumerlaeia bacterium]
MNQTKTSGARMTRWIAMLLTAAWAAMTVPAAASVVVPLSVEQLAAVAEDVVHAKVDKSESGIYKGKIFTRHQLRVEDSLKGATKSGGKLEVVTMGGSFGRLSSIAPGMPTLAEGEEVVLFLSNPAKSYAAKASGVLPALDTESPFIQSPQIVGGFQGKFEVKRREVSDAEGNKSLAPPIVFRATPGRVHQPDQLPDLETFKAQLRSVTKTTDKALITTQNIATVGPVEVVRQSDKAGALRLFDPIVGTGTVREAPKRAAAPAAEQAPAPEAPAE